MAENSTFEKLHVEITACRAVQGCTMADVLDFSSELRHALNIITRSGPVNAAELAPEMALSEDETETLLNMLVEKGYLSTREVQGAPHYNVTLAHKRKHALPFNI